MTTTKNILGMRILIIAIFCSVLLAMTAIGCGGATALPNVTEDDVSGDPTGDDAENPNTNPSPATITTKVTITLEDSKLIRPDAVELSFDDTPVPLVPSIKIVAIAEKTKDNSENETIASLTADEQTSIGNALEGAITLEDDGGNAHTIDCNVTDVSDVTGKEALRFVIECEVANKLAPDTPYTVEINIAQDNVTLLERSGLITAFTTMKDSDINGDGFADLIVGSTGFDGGGTWRGRAHIFLGSAIGIGDCDLFNLDCVPHASISGATDGDSLGSSVDIAGDLNGDGYADIAIGAPEADGTAASGKVYVFYGSAIGIQSCNMEGGCVPDTIIAGATDGDHLGSSAIGSVDVNGDGFDDLVVAAYTAAASGTDRGNVYIFLGSANGIQDCDLSAGCTPAAVITGANDHDLTGYSLSAAGDVNGDGYDDIIIGATEATSPGTQTGQAYIFHGSANGIANCDLSAGCTADATILGRGTWDWLGYSVSSAGDIDADGYDDVIVTKGEDTDLKGHVLVFLGSATGIGNCDLSAGCTPHAEIIGEAHGDYIGDSTTALDINADGYSDIVIGASWYQSVGVFLEGRGRAYVFYGSAAGFVDCDMSAGCTADVTITGANLKDLLGESVANMGDVNGDGVEDLIIGARYHEAGISLRGKAYMMHGTDAGVGDCDLSAGCTPDASILGGHDGEYLGTVRAR